jgi:hypothetical protein
MGVAEIAGSKGVGLGVNDLIRLWKYVEKKKTRAEERILKDGHEAP